jgi:hypothetical protein
LISLTKIIIAGLEDFGRCGFYGLIDVPGVR